MKLQKKVWTNFNWIDNKLGRLSPYQSSYERLHTLHMHKDRHVDVYDINYKLWFEKSISVGDDMVGRYIKFNNYIHYDNTSTQFNLVSYFKRY